MENALDHSRRRLHLRPEPSTPAVFRLTTVLLSIIFQSGRSLEQARRAFSRSFAYPSHAQRSHLLRYLVRTLADPEATRPVERQVWWAWGWASWTRLPPRARTGGIRRVWGVERLYLDRTLPAASSQSGQDAHRPLLVAFASMHRPREARGALSARGPDRRSR
jgi:hypothetical protein